MPSAYLRFNPFGWFKYSLLQSTNNETKNWIENSCHSKYSSAVRMLNWGKHKFVNETIGEHGKL